MIRQGLPIYMYPELANSTQYLHLNSQYKKTNSLSDLALLKMEINKKQKIKQGSKVGGKQDG